MVNDPIDSKKRARSNLRVAVDLLGGDASPSLIYEAACALKAELALTCKLACIATPEVFAMLPKDDGIEYIDAREAVEMDDAPLFAVRRKKNSSMAVGVRLLKERRIDAFVSTGNTGALFATALLHLPRLPTIDRPALLIILPTGERGTVVLDVGANVQSSAQHLLDFARLGILYREVVEGIASPSVALLNIGVEVGKGTSTLKEAYTLLKEHCGAANIPFQGNLEAREVFQGSVDVLVTDGFAGNVFLKTCEGVTSFFLDYVKTRFGRNQSVGGLLRYLHGQFNYSEHPGAFLAGVEGIVVKCHGNSDLAAIKNGIRGAARLAVTNLIPRLKERLNTL